MSAGHPFILGSKLKRSRARVTQKHCRRGSLHSCECWLFLILFAKTREYVLPALICVSVSVCLSVTTVTEKIVDGFVPNFIRRFLGGKGRPSSCCVTIGGSNGQGELYLPQNSTFAGSCTLSEYFPSSCNCCHHESLHVCSMLIFAVWRSIFHRGRYSQNELTVLRR